MVNLDKYSSIFIANWKLNGNSSFLKDYYEKLKVNSNNCTIICSPSIYLKSLKGNNENLFCGAQDVSSFKEGAYTGELSASMLKDNNIDFCLVGHSERRQHFAEKNDNVNFEKISYNDKVAKLSIVGAGMVTTPGVTYKMFRALADEKINILAISTSEIKLSVIINEENTLKAVKKLHTIFELD